MDVLGQLAGFFGGAAVGLVVLVLTHKWWGKWGN